MCEWVYLQILKDCIIKALFHEICTLTLTIWGVGEEYIRSLEKTHRHPTIHKVDHQQRSTVQCRELDIL